MKDGLRAAFDRLPLAASRVVWLGAREYARAYLAQNPAARLVRPREGTWPAVAELARALGGAPDLLVVADADRLASPERLRPLFEALTANGVCCLVLPNARNARALAAWLAGRVETAPEPPEAWAERLAAWGFAGCEILPIPGAPLPQALAEPLEALGAALRVPEAAQRLGAAGFLVRATRHPFDPLVVAAAGLRKVAGVTEARVDFPLQALATLPGVRAVWGEEGLSLKGLPPPGMLVFHRRFLVEPEVQANLERLAAAGWMLVSDQDDDPRHWREYVESDFYAYRCVHAVSVSTEPLAALMRQWNPHVAVLPNGVLALPDRPPRADGRVRIFFGALNRQDDWRPMLPALQGALKRLRDQVEVVVVHDRAFHDALADGVARTFHPTLPPAEYLRVLASCDLALLPLADTPFNRLKSDLKLVECAAAGVVPICSPVVYGSDPHHHEVAVFAETPEQWALALERLVKESEERARRAARGRAWVAAERMHGRLAPARAAWYRRLLAERSRLEEERQARLAAWRARFRTP